MFYNTLNPFYQEMVHRRASKGLTKTSQPAVIVLEVGFTCQGFE